MTDKVISRGTINRITALILICFFFSGLSGLIYEILWTRMIVKLIGGTPFAVSIILTVFMGGLGLGSYLASRTIDRIDEPMRLVRIYGILELIIGGYGLVLPLLLVAFRPVYAILYNQLFNHFLLYNFLTFIGCASLLCIPVICMGATLPILCRFYVTSLSHLGTHAGRLYGLNTIGAAVGSLLCGFWLINHLGIWGTLIFAVLINSIIGLACILRSYRAEIEFAAADEEVSDPGASISEPSVEGTRDPDYPGELTGALVIFAVSGFCAMSYEVIWTKLLGLIVGPTTYSFTIVLVTFILGLALGSILFGWLADRTGKAVWLLIFTQVIAALLVLCISQLLGNSQLFFAKLIFHFQEQFALRNLLKAVVLFVFMIFPTLCLGAAFPLVGKIYTRSISRVGRSIGFAYAINTIGAVLGSFCAGFILIPLVGKENGLSLVIGLQLLTSVFIAGIILSGGRRRIIRLAPLAAPVLAGLILCTYFPEWNRHLLSKGRYHLFDNIKADIKGSGWLEALLKGPEILAGSARGELVYYGEGISGFTTVMKNTGPLGNVIYVMAISGKSEASSRGDMKTQTLCAHFPMLFHKDPKKVMVLGLASGVTAGEVLCYPVEQLDVLEINRQVVAASDFFIPWNSNVLSSPKTNLIIQDGRAHLRLTRQRYDVIISEPSNPWMAGLATLFTRDFFTLAKDRLNEDGIFLQWLHSYQMDWPTFALVGRTFEEVFPNSLLIGTTPSNFGHDDYLLVGFKGKKRLILDNAIKKISYTRKSKNISLTNPRLLYRLIVSEDLQGLFGPGTVNTDSRPRLEFVAPKLIYFVDTMITQKVQANKRLNPTTVDIVQQVTTDVDAQIDFAAYALSVYAPFQDMVDLSKATLSQKDRFFGLMDSYCTNNPVEDSDLKDDNLIRRCHSIQIETLPNKINLLPDKAASYAYLGFIYFAEGMLNEAIASYSKSLLIEPDNTTVHLNMGVALGKQGNLDEAIEHYLEALRIKPDFEEAHNNLGVALFHKGNIRVAINHFREALRIRPDYVDAKNNLNMALIYKSKGND